MADFHKYTFYYTSPEYNEGWERIFGNAKNRTKGDQEGVEQKPSRNAKSNPNRKAKRGQGGKRKSTRRDNLPAQVEGSSNS